MNFEQWCLETFGFVVSEMTDAQKQKCQAIYDAEMALVGEQEEESADEEVPAEMAAGRTQKKTKMKAAIGSDGASTDGSIEERITSAVNKATRLEAVRANQIRALAGNQTELAEKAIAEGWNVDKFELFAHRANRANISEASSEENKDNLAEVYEAALLLHCQMDANRVGKYFSPEVMNRATAKEYRGFSMVECADRIIKRGGGGFNGNRKQESHMRACRDASNKLRAAGFTSMTLNSILENASDKVLLAMYQEVKTVWREFCAIRSLSDFKIHSSYALDATNTFKKVGPQGDFDQLKFSDRKYSLQAESYGLRFKIDFPTWRNDDLNSITSRIGAVGQLGASTIEQIVFFLLMTGIGNAALFHASNNNYLANSVNYALGITGMTNAETLIGNQVRANGTPLGVDFNTLLVGTALKPAAGALYTSTKLNETTTADKGKGSDNPFVSKYVPTVAPYLNNTLLKANDGTTAIPHQDAALWMMFAQNANNAAMNVGFLDGQQTPTVTTISNESEMIGFEFATSMHFGVGYGDPKMALCMNPSNA